MITKIFRSSIIVTLIFCLFIPLSFAIDNQSQSIPRTEDINLPQVEIANSGMTPDNNFYFLKTWKENIILFFTFRTQLKIERRLQFAEVRLAEYKKMLSKAKSRSESGPEKNYQDLAQKCLERYQGQLKIALEKLEKLNSQGKNVESLAQDILQITLKHIQFLQAILLDTPDQTEKGLNDALTSCQQAYIQALEIIEKSGE